MPVLAQDDVTEDVGETSENNVVDGIVAKQHIKNKRHLQPAYVREANVLWAKTIWRIIDLREKQNLYLYYPTNTVDERRSLIRTLIDAIATGIVDVDNSAINLKTAVLVVLLSLSTMDAIANGA